MSEHALIPDGLSELGQRVAEEIIAFLTEHDAADDLAGAFYSPQQWSERGERFGANSLLIVTHDGGDHYDTFNDLSGLNYDLQVRLRALGATIELCESWYSAVFPYDRG